MTLEEFKAVLAELFGQPLNAKAEVAAEDFWGNLSIIEEGVTQGSIAIRVDSSRIARAFPEYRTYQVWKGLAIVLFLIALPVLLFSWQIALCTVLASVLCHTFGNAQRLQSGKMFVSAVVTAIAAGDVKNGTGNLCAQYIAGNVQLESRLGGVHWPRYPSDVLTGQERTVE